MSALDLPLDRGEAQRITDRIKLMLGTITSATEKVVGLIEQAEAGRAWQALGYPSWTAYVAAEFSDALAGLSRVERVPITAKLSSSGMSTRAIAPIMGVGKSTIDRDLEQVSRTGTPEGVQELNTSTETTGTDGKTYPRATFLRSGKPDARTVEEFGRSVPQSPPKPRRRPLPDAYNDAVYDLQKVVERLVRLTEDDRFQRNSEDLFARHGGELERIKEMLHDQVAMPLVRGGGRDD